MTHEFDPSRRAVLHNGLLAGGALLGFGALSSASAVRAEASARRERGVMNTARPDVQSPGFFPENVIHSTCLQCNTGCGIKCRLQDGVVTKIDGNPYSPWTMVPHLPYGTDFEKAAPVDGAICPKGQAGLQTAYDPYRLRRVLKRAGKRGENKWVSIPFEQAIAEICEGGKLFASVPGEADRHVEGLRDIVALRDAEVSKAMARAVEMIWDEKDRAKKAEFVRTFRAEFATQLDKLIDPEHPDLGPKNNQIVLAWGRLKAGRGDFYKRFAAALGTSNAHGHTTVCQGSLYFTCKAISQQYLGGKFTGGKKFYWQADTEHAEFILFVGANLFEANYGPPNRSVRLTDNLVKGTARIAVADPRFSKLASKAWKWLPLRPGTDAALAMAMIRWMFDEGRIDKRFLACANTAAAKAAGEDSYCNATWLVALEKGKPGKFVRAADVGLAETEKRQYVDKKTGEKKTYDERRLAVMVQGVPIAVDPNDDAVAVTGDLFVDTTLADGTRVKSSLQILRDSANERTVAQWCEVAGVELDDVVAVARELTSHGKKAAVDIHRGPAQHTNGFYNVLAWMSVNMLLGNFDARGGMIKATTFDIKGKGKWFDLAAHPGKNATFGVSSIRHGVKYEETTLFAGYPARRNWYPLSSDIYEEIIPSMGDAYPYPIKALFLYMGAPTYALPAGHTNIEILCNLEKVPLFVANDILVGTTSMYADYIFPDTGFLERWEFQGSHPSVPDKVQPVRQPVIAPIPEDVTVFGQPMPMNLEAMILAIAEKLDLPGFGPNGFGDGQPLLHQDHFMLRAVGNLAFGEKRDGSAAVQGASEREVELFVQARRHLPRSVFDLERWKGIVGQRMWPKVVTVLGRGGRFEDPGKSYKGGRYAHPYAALLNLYQEKTGSTIHAGTGEHNPGVAVYLPVRGFDGKEPTALRQGYAFALITHRTISRTKSRTVADPWLSPIMPDNGVLVHPDDAAAKGMRDGQQVRIVSASNPKGEWPLGNGKTREMVGTVKLTQTVRPGVVSFALGFGLWATGATDLVVNGHLISGEPSRARGVHANAAMWVDPSLGNTCFLDPVGGSVSFYDTHVRLEPLHEKAPDG